MISSLHVKATANLLTTFRELEGQNAFCPVVEDDILTRMRELLQDTDEGDISARLNNMFLHERNGLPILYLLRDVSNGMFEERDVGGWVARESPEFILE